MKPKSMVSNKTLVPSSNRCFYIEIMWHFNFTLVDYVLIMCIRAKGFHSNQVQYLCNHQFALLKNATVLVLVFPLYVQFQFSDLNGWTDFWASVGLFGGWMDGWVGSLFVRLGGCGWMDRQVVGSVSDGWMDGGMDGSIGGWVG